MVDSLPHVLFRQCYFQWLLISERGRQFLTEVVISLEPKASTERRPAPACTILPGRWTTTAATVSFDRCSLDSMSELKVYETNPFEKQGINFSRHQNMKLFYFNYCLGNVWIVFEKVIRVVT
jgi:hypothetical protein